MTLKKTLTDHDHDKYIATPKFNKLTAENFAARLKRVSLATKTDFNHKLKSLNQKINSNKAKHLLAENELKKLEVFDLIYFKGKSHFEEDGTQNYLVFQPMYIYFKRVSGVGCGNYICFWKSKGFLNENISDPTASDYKLNPQLSILVLKQEQNSKKGV